MIPFDSIKCINGTPVVDPFGNKVTDIKEYCIAGNITYTAVVTYINGEQELSWFQKEELFHPEPEMYVKVWKFNDGMLASSKPVESIEKCRKFDRCDPRGSYKELGVYKLVKVLALALIIFLSSCSKKDDCIGPGNITITSKSIISWSNNVPVIIEVKGLDNPYRFFIQPVSKKEHRVEGYAEVRVRTQCSGWSEWYTIND
jgi:hypothetical protein